MDGHKVQNRTGDAVAIALDQRAQEALKISLHRFGGHGLPCDLYVERKQVVHQGMPTAHTSTVPYIAIQVDAIATHEVYSLLMRHSSMVTYPTGAAAGKRLT